MSRCNTKNDVIILPGEAEYSVVLNGKYTTVFESLIYLFNLDKRLGEPLRALTSGACNGDIKSE